MKARENPFASRHVERVRFRLPFLTWEELIARSKALGHRAAIVGPKGHGKTTLLDALEPQLRERGFDVLRLRLTEESPRLPRTELVALRAAITSRHFILLDGAEQMNWWRWQQFLRVVSSAAGLLITTHRAGRLPTLIQCETSPLLLETVVDELVPQPLPGLPTAEELFHRHRGNLRDALRELYDRCAALA